MMCLRSLRRPGLGGFPAWSQASRDCPPFQARVVKPRISTLTPQRSSVRARMWAQGAPPVPGPPRLEPELSRTRGAPRLVGADMPRPRRLARGFGIDHVGVVRPVGGWRMGGFGGGTGHVLGGHL